VISGINSGSNLGDDVIYSGTVAGAAEAVLLGIPAIAVSFVDPDNTDFEKGTVVAIKVAEAVFKNTLPRGVFLNVNIPGHYIDGPFEVTMLGSRSYREVIVEKVDPRGKPYYWIGGQADQWRGGEHCDFAAIERGNVSITPLQLNMTATRYLQEIASWRM
jgi:5'-nucleotidase